MADTNITETPAEPDDALMANGVRRSARSKKVPLKYDEEYTIPPEKPSQTTTTTRAERPKRRAAEAARERIVPEEVASLQEEVFARMDIDEWKEYRGWVELESEPAFFNAMLQDLGAKTLKVQEVFALDSAALADLPKPVCGLIFLYEWTNEDESNEARQDCPENLWFGNQTTANACATVALMNIIMNTHVVKFGPELEEFRNTTKQLPPPHRGHALDTNDFIRAIHNSVARRNDLLSEDLLLDNKFQAASKGKKPSPRKKTRSPKSNKPSYESGTYHYIAFVPVDGQVWELDGLESMPLCLGPYARDAWLEIASEAVQNRMRRQNNKFLSFNLVAICQSPLLTVSQNLATSLATAKALDDVVTGSPSWDVPTPWENFPDSRLERFNLTRGGILAEYSPHPSFDTRVNDPNFDLVAAQELAQELHVEQEALEAQYVNEEAAIDEAVEMIHARRRDYTPAVHQWLRILAEKGVLRQLIQEVNSLS
ncbi:ubiquitin carboxyl-terminal hydrolase [Xylaria sp. FL1042]|nr:ubiquitin carboxyl-terminal hydrolase [Xylaria sp. FL1042]